MENTRINELEKIDIELFKKETEEYNKLVSTFNYAKNFHDIKINVYKLVSILYGQF